MEQHKINQYIDRLMEEYGEMSIGEQMMVQDMLESGNTLDECREYLKLKQSNSNLID